MAKAAKKDPALTPEEKLAQALVPESEQPYQIPENWCWTKMSTVAQWGSGGTPSRKHPEYYEGNIPWIKTGELEDNYLFETEEHITEEAISNSSAKLFPVNTIVIAMYGATIGKVGLLGIIATTNQACACGVCSSALNFKYLFYYSRFQKDAFIRKAKGGAQPNISQDIIKNHSIPLPPLTEQQRIVDRIESLFAKLDEAKEKAQAIVDGFEDRKAAILMNGVTGKLTEVWRNRYGFTRSDWKTVKLSEICLLQTGIMKGKHFQTETIKMPYLRVANVQDGFLNLQEIKEIEVEKSNYERYLLKDGDVLFTEGGDFDKLGRGTVWHSEIPNCLHQNHIFVVRPQEGTVLPEYLSYQAGSQYGKKYFLSCSKQTTNLASINSTQLKNFPIMMPSIDEQKEIINIIDGLIASEQKAKEAAEQVIDQIDAMKKSILARAFRGELGTNDPADESAEELLKRIL